MAASPRRGNGDSPSATINLRASAEEKSLIDRAAAALGKSRTEFMLESARRAAIDALLDQRLFVLDKARFAEFARLLDAPPAPTAGLKRLLRTPAPWER